MEVDIDSQVSLAVTHVNVGGDTVGGRTGQRVTTERAGVIPGLEDVRSILAKHGAYRNASTKRLGQLTRFADWCILLPPPTKAPTNVTGGIDVIALFALLKKDANFRSNQVYFSRRTMV